MMKFKQSRFAVLVLLSLVLSRNEVSHAQTSRLWGQHGEKWSPTSRLPDFSFAGYRRGEEPFRIPSASISVADFGAKGDGKTDDTVAFKKAIKAGAGKIVLVPEGRYVLSDVLEIHASNLVLRGAGPEKTVLLFQKPLETLRPWAVHNDAGTPTSNWSWGGGLIMIKSAGNPSTLPGENDSAVSGTTTRGENHLTVPNPVFTVGEEVILRLTDDADKSLVKYLYHDKTGDISGLVNRPYRQVFRVREVHGNELVFDRALRFEVRPQWKPTLSPFRPSVVDSGIEGVKFEFPADRYAGHFKEVGFNPIAIYPSAANCWIKDVAVVNGDNGPFVLGTFCTIDGIRLSADPARKSTAGQFGHHGISLQGDDCLCTHFDVETQFIHDLTVQSAVGCVFCNGKGVNLDFDHHRWGSYENLFTDIDAGEGKRLFNSSGGDNRGMHTAAGETFWNIRGKQPTSWPKDFGPDQLNLIAIPTKDPQVLDAEGRWLETIHPGKIEPANLYEAMLKKRLAATKN